MECYFSCSFIWDVLVECSKKKKKSGSMNSSRATIESLRWIKRDNGTENEISVTLAADTKRNSCPFQSSCVNAIRKNCLPSFSALNPHINVIIARVAAEKEHF